jgi:hypothetical protein
MPVSLFAIATILSGIVLGIGSSLLIASRRRNADSETQALSLVSQVEPTPRAETPPQPMMSQRPITLPQTVAPPPAAMPQPDGFHFIPPRQWPSLQPDILAALWYSHEIPSQVMPALATELLAAGWDGKWLRYCAGETDPLTADLNVYVPYVFLELGARAPLTEDEAHEIIGAYLVKEMAEERLDPIEGVHRVAELFGWNLVSPSRFAALIPWAFEARRGSPEEQPEIRRNITAICAKLMAPVPELPPLFDPLEDQIWQPPEKIASQVLASSPSRPESSK